MQTRYSMNRLMQCADIEAFSARADVGSEAEYFTLLTEFLQASPERGQELTASEQRRDADLFQKKIFELQKTLLSIGAMGLLWEAEKAAECSRKGEWEQCAERTAALVERIRGLSREIRDAQIGSGEKAAEDGDGTPGAVAAAAEEGAGEPGRPRVPVAVEQFEELRLLIEHTDQAMSLIRSMMAFSYNNNIDSTLAALYGSLSKFEQGDAERQLETLLQSARAAQGGVDAKKKILAIDDMPDVLLAIKTLLKNDYSVYGATSHMAALKVLAHAHPALILLDIDMPGMDGFAILDVIRKIKEYENTPVLFLTGCVTVENIVKSRRAGGSDFIKKPIDSRVLLAKIRKHLEQPA